MLWDKCLGMLEAVGEVFPKAKYQRCTVHFYRNVLSVTPRSKVKLVAKMLKQSMLKRARKLSEKKQKPWRKMVLRRLRPIAISPVNTGLVSAPTMSLRG